MSVEIKKVPVNSTEMEYFSFGKGEKPLVILPGLSIKSIMLYKDILPDALSVFGEDFKVYVFDRIKDLPDEYSVDAMARDTITAFEAAGLKDISLYGISQGGMIALSIAILRPDLVSSMVLGSTASRIKPSTAEIVSEWNRFAGLEDEENLIYSFGQKVYSDAFFEQFKDAILDSVRGITSEEFKRLVIMTGNMGSFDVYDRLSDIKCPVFVMAGNEDEIIPVESAKEMIEKLGCESYIFDGFGHAVYDETPEFKDKARDFFVRTVK